MLDKIKEQWKIHCKQNSIMEDRKKKTIPDLGLYGVDCGGYDITGAVQLIIRDNKLILQFNDGDETYYEGPLEDREGKSYWVPRAEFELTPKG